MTLVINGSSFALGLVTPKISILSSRMGLILAALRGQKKCSWHRLCPLITATKFSGKQNI